MLYGMGTVVIFLALLVVATTGMSRIVNRYFPEPVAAAAPSRSAPPPAPAEAELVAVISAAVQQHRTKHGRRKP